jgi:hypothetical protein
MWQLQLVLCSTKIHVGSHTTVGLVRTCKVVLRTVASCRSHETWSLAAYHLASMGHQHPLMNTTDTSVQKGHSITFTVGRTSSAHMFEEGVTATWPRTQVA